MLPLVACAEAIARGVGVVVYTSAIMDTRVIPLTVVGAATADGVLTIQRNSQQSLALVKINLTNASDKLHRFLEGFGVKTCGRKVRCGVDFICIIYSINRGWQIKLIRTYGCSTRQTHGYNDATQLLFKGRKRQGLLCMDSNLLTGSKEANFLRRETHK